MTERQTLLAHLAEHHAAFRGHATGRNERWAIRDTLAQLQRSHGRIHHRYGTAADHLHEPDGEGNPAGPNTDERRPSGWLTGLKVIPRQSARRAG